VLVLFSLSVYRDGPALRQQLAAAAAAAAATTSVNLNLGE